MLKTLIRGSQVEPAAATICDQHGAALLALATVLAGDHGSAEAAVVDVIGAGFPVASMAVPMPAADMRRQLAKRVYLSCGSRHDDEQAALALTQHGQLTYRAAADLLGLSGTAVARGLGAALRRNASAEVGVRG